MKCNMQTIAQITIAAFSAEIALCNIAHVLCHAAWVLSSLATISPGIFPILADRY